MGSVANPRVVVFASEQQMVEIVGTSIKEGARITISRDRHAGYLEVWRELDGLMTVYQVNGKDRKVLGWPVWAHRVRKLLTETSEKKEGA